jgi:hypothetical protein
LAASILFRYAAVIRSNGVTLAPATRLVYNAAGRKPVSFCREPLAPDNWNFVDEGAPR